MDYDPNRPIWLQVMTDLETDIITGKRAPGEKLPGGRELALRYGINPNTAARVYQELERKGLCETRRGLGTFITEDGESLSRLREEAARSAISDCLDRLRLLGFSREQALEMIRTMDS